MSAVKVFVPTVARFISGVTLRHRDKDVQGYYVAAAGLSKDWRGCAVMHTLDDGQTWTQLARIMSASMMGTVMEVWDDANGDAHSGGMLVRTLHPAMQLESHSAADVEGGKNRAYVGGMVISYANAALVAPQTYALTGLTLGRKQTNQVALRAGMAFTELTSTKLARIDVLDERRAQGRYAVVSMNQKITDEPAIDWAALSELI